MPHPSERTQPDEAVAPPPATPGGGYGERAGEFANHMTDAEALMWNVEKDPWLSSTIGTLAITDSAVDVDRFRRRIAHAVASIGRLRARVVPRLGRLAAPAWETDPEFDLGYHVRHLRLPAPGDQATLLELCCRLIEDPFDRTRPLWQFFIVDGVADGRGALLVKLHHSVTDGIGAIRLAEQYMDLGPDVVEQPEVDLDAVVAADLAARQAGTDDTGGDGEDAAAATATAASTGAGGGPPTLAQYAVAALHGASQAARVPTEVARRWAGDALLAMADPARIPELGGSLVQTIRSGMAQLEPSKPGPQSVLWARRSRHRALRTIDLELDALHGAAKAMGVSLNDLFVAAVAAAAGRYHRTGGLELDRITVSFIVSTRHGADVAGNAFSPVKACIPTGMSMAVGPFLEAVREELAARRAEAGGGAGLLSSLAGAVNLLPTSVVTRLARTQAASVDLATSNVRAAPFPVYIAGARVLASYPIGPVAATAGNVTMMSYDGRIYVGLHVDPRAIDDPDRFRDDLEAAFADLIDAARPSATVSPTGSSRRRPSTAPSSSRRRRGTA